MKAWEQDFFGLEDGQAYQKEKLRFYERILKPEMFEKLLAHVKSENEKLRAQMTKVDGTVDSFTAKAGYRVFRGSEFENWIVNNL